MHYDNEEVAQLEEGISSLWAAIANLGDELATITATDGIDRLYLLYRDLAAKVSDLRERRRALEQAVEEGAQCTRVCTVVVKREVIARPGDIPPSDCDSVKALYLL